MADRRRTILILEDSEPTRDALCAVVQRLGFTPVPAASVADAMGRLAGHAFAILDVRLPDGSGLDVLRLLGAENPATRCAVITAAAHADVRAEAVRLGAELAIVKPALLAELTPWLCSSGGAALPAGEAGSSR